MSPLPCRTTSDIRNAAVSMRAISIDAPCPDRRRRSRAALMASEAIMPDP